MKRKIILLIIGSITTLGTAHAEELQIKLNGFILPKFIFSSSALNSFSTQTETAPTAVSVGTGSSGLNSHPRTTWQIGQSRFGSNFKYGPKLTGKLEIDFFNNNDASPEFSLLAPRLRIAKIDYKISDDLSLTAGQDWDIFNGDVGPFTYNVVGNYFQTGNVGFIRQQLALKSGGSTGLNVSIALGMPQKNDNSATGAPVTDNTAELNLLPTFAMNMTYKQDEKSFFGMSAIASRILYTPSTDDFHSAFGLSAFIAQSFTGFELRAKAYFGRNLGNLNMLTLSNGGGSSLASNSYDFIEAGGFITGRIPIGELYGVFGGVGYATGLNAGDIPSTISGNILTGNLKIGAGLDYSFVQNLKAYSEFSFLNSTYNQGSAGNVISYAAGVVDIGMKLDI